MSAPATRLDGTQPTRPSDRARAALATAIEKEPQPLDGLTLTEQIRSSLGALDNAAKLGDVGAASRAAAIRLSLRRSVSKGKSAPVLQVSDSVSYLPPEVGEAVLLAVGVDPVEARRIALVAHRRAVQESESPPIAE